MKTNLQEFAQHLALNVGAEFNRVDGRYKCLVLLVDTSATALAFHREIALLESDLSKVLPQGKLH